MATEYITPAQVAERLQVSTQFVYLKIHSGDWDCLKISARTYRFTKDQFERITSGLARPSRKSNKARLNDALKKIA